MTDEALPEISGSVKRDGDMIVIRMPANKAHSLRVALQACPCRAAKSAGTGRIRAQLDKAIGRILAGRAL